MAEGVKSDLDGFVGAVTDYFAENIDHQDATTSPATSEFQSFEIRR